MKENVPVKDRFYISASDVMVDPRRLILKDNDLFGVFDRYGDIVPFGNNDTGLYYGGIRFLSSYELRMNGRRLLFLSADVDEDNVVMNVDLTNPDIYIKERLVMNKDSLHIMRSRVLIDDDCFESICIRNFGGKEIQFQLEIAVDSDFRDIFEIRGMKRNVRGNLFPPEKSSSGLSLYYEGLDDRRRITSISAERHPDQIEDSSLFFDIDLKPDDMEVIHIAINCSSEKRDGGEAKAFSEAVAARRHSLERLTRNSADISASNEQFNSSVKRALADINMMLTKTDHGYYPYGGIPWFCTPFGRDGLITALECLWINPEMAKGVLKYLAKKQAVEFEPSKASEPGKILHEARMGEMAALNEIPFGQYYGSVDSTPLFLMLAGAYWRRMADSDLIRELWPAIQKSIAWLETFGDPDGDGFLEYTPHKEGLRNQGWKDSQDSISHADGSLAEGSIALCEVQGYCYAAKTEAAAIARFMGEEKLAEKLLNEAAILKEAFNREFWDDEMGVFVLALDGDKKPCRVLSSNAGHALFSGIAEPGKALKTAQLLTSVRMFSGWGIRTLAEGEALYNPISYHNGSVWPHDNAMIAGGMAFYGLEEHFLKVFGGIFDASLFMELNRLPELFCGFQRRKKAAPTLYPVACSPQTWAAGSLLYMVQASLGMFFEAEKDTVIFRNPILPGFLSSIYLTNLIVSKNKTVDLHVNRYGEGVTLEVIRKSPGVTVLTYN
jgi:glycogen debranching enzyme